MNGPRGYCAEWSKSSRERQMPHDLTYMWNLKNKISIQNRNKLIDTQNILMVSRWEGIEGMSKKRKKLRKIVSYKIVMGI